VSFIQKTISLSYHNKLYHLLCELRFVNRRSEINKVQGEYAQQREYGFAPSFSRTQRIGSQNDDSRTLTDESDPMQSNSFIILPPDVSDENVLPAIKHKLDTLHPSQRDYVSTQLLCEVSKVTNDNSREHNSKYFNLG
jgi:hypothetical protein